MEEIPELKVEEYYHARKVMHLAKELILKNEKLNLVSGTKTSPIASRASESLVRFGYVTIANIQTLTEVKNDRRNIKLIITLKKTNDFQKIYDENKEEIKKKEQEKEQQAKEKEKEK